MTRQREGAQRRRATSSGPITATTPGAFRAAAASTPRIRACGCGLRTMAAVSVPGSGSRSSRKRPLAAEQRGVLDAGEGVGHGLASRSPDGGRGRASPARRTRRRRARGAGSCPPRTSGSRSTATRRFGRFSDGSRSARAPRVASVRWLGERTSAPSPARGTTNAVTAWPQRSSGSPTTTTSPTRRAADQDLLDLVGVDVLAAGDDHVVDAARTPSRSPSSSATAEVAGEVPAVADGLARRRPGGASSRRTPRGSPSTTATWPCSPGPTTASGDAPGAGSTSRTRVNTPARPGAAGLGGDVRADRERVDLGAAEVVDERPRAAASRPARSASDGGHRRARVGQPAHAARPRASRPVCSSDQKMVGHQVQRRHAVARDQVERLVGVEAWPAAPRSRRWR